MHQVAHLQNSASGEKGGGSSDARVAFARQSSRRDRAQGKQCCHPQDLHSRTAAVRSFLSGFQFHATRTCMRVSGETIHTTNPGFGPNLSTPQRGVPFVLRAVRSSGAHGARESCLDRQPVCGRRPHRGTDVLYYLGTLPRMSGRDRGAGARAVALPSLQVTVQVTRYTAAGRARPRPSTHFYAADSVNTRAHPRKGIPHSSFSLNQAE